MYFYCLRQNTQLSINLFSLQRMDHFNHKPGSMGMQQQALQLFRNGQKLAYGKDNCDSSLAVHLDIGAQPQEISSSAYKLRSRTKVQQSLSLRLPTLYSYHAFMVDQLPLRPYFDHKKVESQPQQLQKAFIDQIVFSQQDQQTGFVYADQFHKIWVGPSTCHPESLPDPLIAENSPPFPQIQGLLEPQILFQTHEYASQSIASQKIQDIEVQSENDNKQNLSEKIQALLKIQSARKSQQTAQKRKMSNYDKFRSQRQSKSNEQRLRQTNEQRLQKSNQLWAIPSRYVINCTFPKDKLINESKQHNKYAFDGLELEQLASSAKQYQPYGVRQPECRKFINYKQVDPNSTIKRISWPVYFIDASAKVTQTIRQKYIRQKDPNSQNHITEKAMKQPFKLSCDNVHELKIQWLSKDSTNQFNISALQDEKVRMGTEKPPFHQKGPGNQVWLQQNRHFRNKRLEQSHGRSAQQQMNSSEQMLVYERKGKLKRTPEAGQRQIVIAAEREVPAFDFLESSIKQTNKTACHQEFKRLQPAVRAKQNPKPHKFAAQI